MKRPASSRGVLLTRLHALLDSVPLDEAAVYATVQQLMERHGLTRAAIAQAVGRHGKAVFRIVASYQPDLAPYRAMCGDRSSVVEALRGIAPSVRDALREQFEHTGRAYRQAELRQIRRRLDHGETFSLTWITAEASSQKPARVDPLRRVSPVSPNSDTGDDTAFLQELADIIMRSDLRPSLQFNNRANDGKQTDRMHSFTSQPSARHPAPSNSTPGEPILHIRLTEAQARQLIARLGGQADLPAPLLHEELMRLIYL